MKTREMLMTIEDFLGGRGVEGSSQRYAVELFGVPNVCLQRRIYSVVWSHDLGIKESP